MDNIIFLDIDGVLNDNMEDVKDSSVLVCKKLISRDNCKVVVISSNQGSGTIEKRKRLSNYLENLGISVFDYIDPNFKGDFSNRTLGIINYLKNNICNYVILDDEYSDEYESLGLNYFKTGMWTGLLEEDLDKIELMIVDVTKYKNIKYEYRSLGAYEKVTNDLIKVLRQIKSR